MLTETPSPSETSGYKTKKPLSEILKVVLRGIFN